MTRHAEKAEHQELADGRWRKLVRGPSFEVMWVVSGRGDKVLSSRPGALIAFTVVGLTFWSPALLFSGELGVALFGVALGALAAFVALETLRARQDLLDELAGRGPTGPGPVPTATGAPAAGTGAYLVQLVRLEGDHRGLDVVAYRELQRCGDLESASAAAHHIASAPLSPPLAGEGWNSVQVLHLTGVTAHVVVDLDVQA